VPAQGTEELNRTRCLILDQPDRGLAFRANDPGPNRWLLHASTSAGAIHAGSSKGTAVRAKRIGLQGEHVAILS
jgi:hypothetical protein